MCKSSKTKTFYNQEILEELKNKYDVTYQYIIMSIKEERTGTLSIQIKEDYDKMNAASRMAIQNKAKQLNNHDV